MWYRKITGEQIREDRGRNECAEKEARLRRWGLWQDRNPVPPWNGDARRIKVDEHFQRPKNKGAGGFPGTSHPHYQNGQPTTSVI